MAAPVRPRLRVLDLIATMTKESIEASSLRREGAHARSDRGARRGRRSPASYLLNLGAASEAQGIEAEEVRGVLAGRRTDRRHAAARQARRASIALRARRRDRSSRSWRSSRPGGPGAGAARTVCAGSRTAAGRRVRGAPRA